MASPGENLYLAKLAEQAERYEEMVKFMDKFVEAFDGDDLSMEQRNLLSVAYKNVVAPRRASCRMVASIEQKEAMRGNVSNLSAVEGYRFKIEDELSSFCYAILKLLDLKLIRSASNGESKAFYLKMKGDYNRYLSEFKTGSERTEAAEATLSAYEQAQEIATAVLAPTHPTRLGLALNFSVFYFEILSSPERACNLARQAFDEATAELDSLGKDTYKDSTTIMHLLSDNLRLWTSDMQDDFSEEKGAVPKPDNK